MYFQWLETKVVAWLKVLYTNVDGFKARFESQGTTTLLYYNTSSYQC